MSEDFKPFTDIELLYSATSRCKCGAGLAYPLDHKEAMAFGGWACSALLKRETSGRGADRSLEAFGGVKSDAEHDFFPWAFFKIREEGSVNDRFGATTRPPGTVHRHVLECKCPRCKTEWKSEPYQACGGGSHLWGATCPSCGHKNVSGAPYVDGDRVEERAKDVIFASADIPPHAHVIVSMNDLGNVRKCKVCNQGFEIGGGV